MSIKILLVDDHKIIRDGLKALIDNLPGMVIVAEAGDGYTAVRQAEKHCPDIVIMDISMPDLNGIEATRQILDKLQYVKIIALSMFSDRRFVSGMFKAGVSGYLLKDCAFEELAHAIETVRKGKSYLSPGIADIVVKDYSGFLSAHDDSEIGILTDREREVLQLIAEGKSTRQIASKLNISVSTVETHRRQLMIKLDVKTVPELTRIAIREGLTPL